MTTIPDSSVPITTGTAPDLGPINPSVGQVQGASVPATGLFPKPEYTPRVEEPKNYRPAEFGISEAVWGGMLQTAWAAAMMANDMPAFEVMPNFDAEAELLKMEQELRYQVSNDDREHLLRSRSPSEFMYRQFQLDEKARGLQAMAARPIAGVIGATADVDIALGYGIGAASRIAGASRAATMANLTVGTAAGTAGTYAYAGDRAPFSTADAATHVALSSSLAFLYGTGFKYTKPITKVKPPPKQNLRGVNFGNDFEMDSVIERGIIQSTGTPKPDVPKNTGITFSIPEDGVVEAYFNGVKIGHMWFEDHKGVHKLADLEVDAPYRRKGIATQMLQLARSKWNVDASHTVFTDDGASWARSTDLQIDPYYREIPTKKKRSSKKASKKVTSKPEEATDEDLLDAIDDFNDDDFKDLD